MLVHDGEIFAPQPTPDDETGLMTRAAFLERLAAEVASGGGQGDAIGLVIVDLDWFADTARRLGRADAGALLRGVAGRLRGVPGIVLAGRFGDDEFAFLIRSHPAPLAAAAAVACVREPFRRGSAAVELTASAGSASFPADALSPTGLLRRAEVALFYAKNSGRDRAVAYERTMRTELAAKVRASVGQGNFVLQYQPIASLQPPGGLLGLEALMRWRHPERGVLQPGAFQALFENPEVAMLVGQTALDQALGEAGRWMRCGVGFGTLSLNVSAAQLRHPDFVEQAASLIVRHAVPPRCVRLDLPAVVAGDQDPAETAAAIAAIREIGVGVAFPRPALLYGLYAGLPRPGDWLKAPMPAAPDLVALLAEARAAGLTLVLERVERPDQMARARMAGAEGAQGFAYSRPLAPEDVAAFASGA
jgi:diguanylate cyclase (GGDEF)-like protein